MRRTVMTIALLAAVTGTAHAQKALQESGGRHARQGFWIGFGLGAGSAGFDCATCPTDRENAGSGYLRLGGTLSPSFLLGVEMNGWSRSESGTDQAMAMASLMAHWYPSRRGALYIKFGIGGLAYMEDDGTDEYSAAGPAAVVGVGYEIRVTRNMSLTPFLNSMASGNTELRVNDQVVATNADFKLNLVQVGLGLTWH